MLSNFAVSPYALPFELIDHVVGYAQYDADTLRACSLVCQLWHAASRFFVLREITLRSEVDLLAFEELLESIPGVAQFVRCLRIVCSHRHGTPNNCSTETLWLQQMARDLPSKLNHLDALRIVDLSDDGRTCDTGFFSDLSSFTSVTKLTLQTHNLATPVLYSFASVLPNLRHLSTSNSPLHVCGRTPDFYGDEESRTARTFPSRSLRPLKSLSVRASPSALYDEETDQLLDYLSQSGSIAGTESLNLVVLPFSMDVAGELIQSLGSTLRNLELMVPIHTSQKIPTIVEKLYLKTCSRLETLSLHCTGPTQRCAQAMASLLSSQSSPFLRRVSLHLGFPGSDLTKGFAPLVESFKGTEIASTLEEVHFIYEGGLELPAAEREIRSTFEVLSSRLGCRLTVDCACIGVCTSSLLGYHCRIGDL